MISVKNGFNANSVFEKEINEFKMTEGGAIEMAIAADIGSTQTRVVEFDLEGNSSEVLAIDSEFYMVSKDISHVDGSDNTFGSNLEAIVTDETGNLGSMHIVKGNLRKSVGAGTFRTTASSSKIEQVPTYVNLVFAIAVAALAKADDAGFIPETVKVDLSVALPPEDTTFGARMDVFKSKLAGTFKVEFVRIGKIITLEFNRDDILIASESDAVAIYTSINSAEDTEGDVSCFLDIGGRSAGISFIIDGVLARELSSTAPFGGRLVLEDTANLIAEKYNIMPLRTNVIQDAMATGMVRLGNKKIDVSDCITQAKRQLATRIFEVLMQSLDKGGLQAQEVSKVYCSGRSYGISVDENGTVKSTSIMTILEEMYHERSPFTEFERVQDANPIVIGMTYLRYSKLDA